MFYNQPLALRFGNELLRHIDPCWDSLDIAVAWVRASGMKHLSDRLESFLQHGGHLSIIVGIDLQNTTREGLQALLDLESHGNCETFVYHNESGSIFHPKLYLFRNEEEARLIVGSNNLTEAGLYSNVEAGLQVDTNIEAEVITQALDAISSWKDTTSKFAVRLDTAFLDLLSREQYVPEEALSRAQFRQVRENIEARQRLSLFASRRFNPPTPQRRSPSATQLQEQLSSRDDVQRRATSGTVLLMRLRKASTTGRPTQTQVPFRVFDNFFSGTTEVQSVHTGQAHGIHQASARGSRNTFKLEIPEMRNFSEPVARFEKTSNGIVYEVYDVGTPQGDQIMASLVEGRRNNMTQLSISNPQSATWWRYI